MPSGVELCESRVIDETRPSGLGFQARVLQGFRVSGVRNIEVVGSWAWGSEM